MTRRSWRPAPSIILQYMVIAFSLVIFTSIMTLPASAWRSNLGSKSQFPCAVDPASCAPPSSSSNSGSRSNSSSSPGNSSSGEYSTPRGEGWFCRAESRSGAWGWAEKSTESAARGRALEICRQYSRGQNCTLRYCRYGGGSAAAAGPGRSPGLTREPPRQKTRVAVDCSSCETIMRNTIRARIGAANTFLLPQTVRQAQGEFTRCEQKTAERMCYAGRIQVRSINGACNGFLNPLNAPAYEQCINSAVP